MNIENKLNNDPLIVESLMKREALSPAKRLFQSLNKHKYWDDNTYLLSENSWIKLNPYADNRVALKLIVSSELGCGSLALDYLCSLADLAECEIMLSVCPQKIMHTRKLTKPQLKKWYKKRGFVQSAEYAGDVFIRLPKKDVSSHGL